jgi:hypothetical protein
LPIEKEAKESASASKMAENAYPSHASLFARIFKTFTLLSDRPRAEHFYRDCCIFAIPKS